MPLDHYTPETYREIRHGLGLTQSQLAAELGVTPAIIQMRETSKRSITREASLALQCVLETVIRQSLEEREEPEPETQPESTWPSHARWQP